MGDKQDITTFQFLEKLQSDFLTEIDKNGSGPASKYETRRVINFFENTGSLQILYAEPTESGEQHLATVSLQDVSDVDDDSTFAVNIEAAPFERAEKMLALVPNESSLTSETQRLIEVLKKQFEAAIKELESAGSEAADDSGDSSRASRRDRSERTERPSRRERTGSDDDSAGERRRERSSISARRERSTEE